MIHYTVSEVIFVRFSELLSHISENISLKILQCNDSIETTDVALIDGSESDYCSTTLYFGYVSQLSGIFPAQCVLAQDVPLTLPENYGGSAVLAKTADLFRLFNTAREQVEQPADRGLYAELMDCAARARSIDPVINLAATRLGNSLVLLDRDFKILAHSVFADHVLSD